MQAQFGDEGAESVFDVDGAECVLVTALPQQTSKSAKLQHLLYVNGAVVHTAEDQARMA